MTITPKNLIKLVRFTTGRRIFTMRQVRRAAVALNVPELIDHIDRSIAHDREVLRLETGWRSRRQSRRQHDPEARRIDIRVDHAVTGIRDVAQMYVRTASMGDPVHSAATRFLNIAFPGGVFPITSLPFVEQLAAVERLQALIATELGAEAAALGLGSMLVLLSALTDEYRAVLDRGPRAMNFAEVKTAREAGQDRLAVLVAMILTYFPRTDESTDTRARAALLGPILQQQAAIRRHLAERRAVPDIDPGGEENADGEEDTDTGPDATERQLRSANVE